MPYKMIADLKKFRDAVQTLANLADAELSRPDLPVFVDRKQSCLDAYKAIQILSEPFESSLVIDEVFANTIFGYAEEGED